ncbi:mitochondrial 1-acyl-sn-glycerol-3-phosphate acyltransferase 3 [Andalucia godoyi]|uniref:Mitochondrial 1-acyl-sn-glycerol-3-phosphate acyltransferase 3 n=1 Tax=Andalucia godoyi TaxID=505711 RepID=A0A8K0AHR0_ANDGO|nr:mitochondrial 1-acyl-sn-glycerol-3-phosphate acyltransferase 3 [Andalucia godoyi]|eukprot:ANDGO_03178.mRNA.1 mitochondrial 1-acyl-sn-glycerol-3-phosphate acyltransferase 3
MGVYNYAVALLAFVFVTTLAVLVISLYALLAPLYPLFPVTIHRVICRLSEMGWSLFSWYSQKTLKLKFHYMDSRPLKLSLWQSVTNLEVSDAAISNAGTVEEIQRKTLVVAPSCATLEQLPISKWPIRESAFICANHRGDMDWLVSLMYAYYELHSLSFTKFFVKQSLLYVPLFGYGMLMTGFIFVRRKWENDKKRIEEAFSRILEVGKTVPLHLYCFLEGSRFTEKKKAQCDMWVDQQLRHQPHAVDGTSASSSGSSSSLDSITSGTGFVNPKLLVHKMQWVLQPRTKGFVASLKGLKGKLEAVYDLTIAYERDDPVGFWHVLAQLGQREVHVLVRRWPIHELPESDEDRSRWAFMLYSTKDAALDYFFDGPGNQKVFPPSHNALMEYHQKVYLPKMVIPLSRAGSVEGSPRNGENGEPGSKKRRNI